MLFLQSSPHSFLPRLPGPEAKAVSPESRTGGVGEQVLWNDGEMPCRASWVSSGPHAGVS